MSQQSRIEPGFFTEVSGELADRNWALTSRDKLAQWARTGSLMGNQFGLAWC